MVVLKPRPLRVRMLGKKSVDGVVSQEKSGHKEEDLKKVPELGRV